MLVARTCLKALRADPAPGPFTSAKSIPATRALRRMSQSRACDDTPYSELRESNEFGFLKYRIVDTDPDGSSLDDEVNHLQTELFNIAESSRCAVEADIRDVSGHQRSW